MVTVVLSVYGTGNKPLVDQPYLLKQDANVQSLLTELEEKRALPKRFGDTTDFQDLLVMVDKQNIFTTGGLGTVLKEGARVVILTAVAGG